MNDTYKLRIVGGALMVTIPQKIVRILSLKAGDEVKLRVVSIGTGGAVSVEPQRKSKKNGTKK